MRVFRHASFARLPRRSYRDIPQGSFSVPRCRLVDNDRRIPWETDAGHGGKSGRDGAIEEIALDYAFALKISEKI